MQATRPIESKTMLGGLGLFLKVDSFSESAYIERGMAAWSLSPKAYRELPEDVLVELEQCGEWLDAARDAAVRQKVKRR